MSELELKKKLAEAKREIRDLKKQIFELENVQKNNDRAFTYLDDLLERYAESSWNFNENTLHEALVVMRGMILRDW